MLVTEYVDEMEGKTCVIPEDSAIMFCYFNSLELFHRYLDDYQGDIITMIPSSYLDFLAGPCVILIGPVAGERHCDPQPRYLVDNLQWKLVDNLVVRGDDEVAIYHRQEKCQV